MCRTALAFLAVLGAGCKPAEIPAKQSSISEDDALAALFEGSASLFSELETTATNAEMDLESDFEGDWPRNGSATLRPGSSSVATTYVVDRTEYGWPEREWSVELQLEPLIIDGVRFTGVLQGSWSYQLYQEVEIVEHVFSGEVDWEGTGESVKGDGGGTTSLTATMEDGAWVLRNGILDETILQEGTSEGDE